jgi:hypothetical protein
LAEALLEFTGPAELEAWMTSPLVVAEVASLLTLQGR